MSKFFTGLMITISFVLVGCQSDNTATMESEHADSARTKNIQPSENLETIAENAYLYGLQQAIFYGQRWIYTQNDAETNDAFAGNNRFFWVREKITPDFPVISPNATTLYGSGFVDFSQGPVVIEVPEIADRYFSVQVMDQYGIFRMTVGSPFNGTAARKYLLLPEGYEGQIPKDFPTTEIVQWPSKTAYALVRMAVKTGSQAEIQTINDYQDELTMTTLSDWEANGRKGIPQSETQIEKGDYTIPERLPEYAVGQVDNQTAEDYFTLLNTILNDPTMTLMPDSLMETRMLEQLASVNIGPGMGFSWDALSDEQRSSLEAGFKAGFDSVRETATTNLIDMNGWKTVRNAGGFETRWMDRALMADLGWAGPDRNISHGAAFLFADSVGEPLSGSNNYTLTFDLDDLPPVTQFWSIPIYDANGYFVANEIDRYTINSFMLEAGQLFTKDNKLVIYIQNQKPENSDQAKNWLPAPSDGFRFISRYYGPYPPLTEGYYQMPNVQKVDN